MAVNDPAGTLMAKEHGLVSVVIPFFQKKTGLLARAVASVCSQSYPGFISILVVDDGCPLAAAAELSSFEVPDNRELTVIRQTNRGPGAARNLGLENVNADTIYTAFLDSDDWWYTDHLDKAVRALGDLADLYFSRCDYEDEQKNQGAEQGFKRFIAGLGLDPCSMEQDAGVINPLPIVEYLDAPGQIITSSVVVRWREVSSVRFREELPNGQDIAYFMDVFKLTRRIAFSTDKTFAMCFGVNIWSSGGKSASKALRIALNERKMLYYLKSAWGDEPRVKRRITAKLQRNAENLAYLFSRLENTSSYRYALRSFLQEDSKLFLYLATVPWRALLSRLKSRRN